MDRTLSFGQVLECGRLADWWDPYGDMHLRWEPQAGGLLWIADPAAHHGWRPYVGKPPVDGWKHVDRPCDCPYCADV